MEQQNWLQLNTTYLRQACDVLAEQLAAAVSRQQAGEASFQLAVELPGIAENSEVQPALLYLAQRFNLSAFEQLILLLCAAEELREDVPNYIGQIHGDATRIQPTYQLVLALFPSAHWSALLPDSPLQRYELLQVRPAAVFTQSRLAIDPVMLHYLLGMGMGIEDERFGGVLRTLSTPQPLPPSQRQTAVQLERAMSQSPMGQPWPVFQLTGPNEDDKTSLAMTAALSAGVPLFTLSLEAVSADKQEQRRLVRLLNRFTLLTNTGYYLKWGEDVAVSPQQRVMLQQLLDDLRGVLFVTTSEPLRNIQRTALQFGVDIPAQEEQQQLWKTALSLNGQSATQLADLTYNFRFSARTLERLAQQTRLTLALQQGESLNEKELMQKLHQVCHAYTRSNLTELAQRIDPIATWEDLALPKAQKEVLRKISLHLRERQRVYYEWGFASKSHRGLGISALFAGPSGTGKTMAAEVLANDLNLDVYKVDLSQVINKYIGETEKNLRKIFDAAEASGAILLFDEADALFGKRSDVKDSHDRHANIEVSYLLQRMESYRGLAILTTNMKTALDQAFLRRIRFVVQFPFPNIELRQEIWQRVFPDNTPLATLDWQRLARLNLAGGNIKNIALNAAFLAAGAQQAVNMQHLQRAASTEYAKLEKPMSTSERLI